MKAIKKRMAQVLGFMLSLCLIISTFGAESASAGVMMPVNGEDLTILVQPGKTTHYTVPIRVRGEGLQLYSIGAECSSTLMRVDNLQLLDSKGEPVKLAAGIMVYPATALSLDFDVVADDALKIGYNTINFSGVGFDFSGDYYSDQDTFDLVTLTTFTNTELEPPMITASQLKSGKALVPGASSTFYITVKNEGDITALNTFATVNFGTSGIIPDYTVSKIKIGELGPGAQTMLSVPVKVLPTAKAGMYSITVDFTCKNRRGESYGDFSYDMYVDIVETQSTSGKGAALDFTTESNYMELERETDDSILLKLENIGEDIASKISITCASGLDTTSGITRRYTTDSIEVADIKAGKATTVEVPVAISKTAGTGLHELVFTLDYSDSDGKLYSRNLTMYVNVKANEKEELPPEEVVRNYITINNVSQSPASPAAGEKVTVSFDIVNEGNADVSNFRLYGSGYSQAGFEPVSSEPYKSVGAIGKGTTKHASMTFLCGEEISSGTNTLTIGYDYIDASGSRQQETVSLYILNVKSAAAVDVGRPKLIVNAYGTDKDVLKAGDTFEFSFTFKNTHASKDAKNIKITLSQDDGIFAPASGTNIFYIEQIKAGEESTQTMTMKTRADATTGDYTVRLLVEYEYDDMSAIDLEKGGVSEENDIKLRATENYRPVISNLYVEAWDIINVGSTVDLSFEFYNMGKSTLGNVYVTVEGDFVLANNSSMSYIGAVTGYGQEYVNPQVVPLVAGEAMGTLIVHFEDSNGDEVTVSQDFSCYVEEAGGFDDPGMWEDPGMWDDPGMWEDPGMNEDPDNGNAKKGLFGMPLWLTIVLAAVLVAVIVVVVIVIVKKAKKNKSVKEDDDEDY